MRVLIALLLLIGAVYAATFESLQTTCTINTSFNGDVGAACTNSGACKIGLLCTASKCTAPTVLAAGASNCTQFQAGLSTTICPAPQFCSSVTNKCTSRLASGAACNNAEPSPAQCAFGEVCLSSKCTAIRSVAEGGVCDSTTAPLVCAAGTFCKRDSATTVSSAGKCTKFLARGADCGTAATALDSCAPEDYCKANKCTVRIADGADCTAAVGDAAGCAAGLVCNVAAKKCQKQYSQAVGADCSTSTHCVFGSFCLVNGTTSGKCTAGKKPTEDCSITPNNCEVSSSCICNGSKYVCSATLNPTCTEHLLYAGPVNDVAASQANLQCCSLKVAGAWQPYTDAVCAFAGAATLKMAVAPFLLVAMVVLGLLF